MNFIRIVTFSLAFVFSAALAFSQEAVDESTGKKADEKTEKADKPEKKRAEKPARSIQELMTPEEFKAAGLDKLGEDELQHLDAWLQGYRQTTEKKASVQAEQKATEEIKKVTEKAQAEAKAKPKILGVSTERIVSRIDGTFIGLTGHTIIKFEDGTVWKQANQDDRYQSVVTDHPMASVGHSGFGYKMRVEGMPEFYVNPVRPKQ
jgi:hypothetical protein